MVTTFFVDENDSALGKALAEVYGNVVFPGHPDLPEVPKQSADDEWLEVVKRMWVEHRVRGFVLT